MVAPYAIAKEAPALVTIPLGYEVGSGAEVVIPLQTDYTAYGPTSNARSDADKTK